MRDRGKFWVFGFGFWVVRQEVLNPQEPSSVKACGDSNITAGGGGAATKKRPSSMAIAASRSTIPGASNAGAAKSFLW
jgi:hypothetical protein